MDQGLLDLIRYYPEDYNPKDIKWLLFDMGIYTITEEQIAAIRQDLEV
jgi:hypothetical protein